MGWAATLGFLSGLIAMGYVISGVFFLKFWARTRDTLFFVFAAAFWLLAANQALLTLGGIPREERSWGFLLRLAAFTLIIAAIAWKNLRPRAS